MGLMTIAANAQLNYTVQTACHPDDVKHYDTERLRSSFLMEKVMAPDEINLTYTLYDRLIYGGAMPVNKVLVLETFDDLKAEHFLDRRELGVINIGGDGIVTVDGKEYKAFEIPADGFGTSCNLIFNNNGGGIQHGDYNITADRDIFLTVTAEGVSVIE